MWSSSPTGGGQDRPGDAEEDPGTLALRVGWPGPGPATSVPAAAAVSTAGAALAVAIPTAMSTTSATARATTLYTGQGTPAIRICDPVEAIVERTCSTVVIV